MLNGPAFTDRTGHGQTTFPKFPRFAMAGPTATARLAQMTAVGCAAITVSDNRTIGVQFLEGYAAQRGVNAPPPLNNFYIYFLSDIVTVLYHAYVFAPAKISALLVCNVTQLGWGEGGGGRLSANRDQIGFFFFFFQTAVYFSDNTYYLPRPSLVDTMSCYFKPRICQKLI